MIANADPSTAAGVVRGWHRSQYRMKVVLRSCDRGNYVYTLEILKQNAETSAEASARPVSESGKWAILDADTQRLIITSFDERSLNHMVNCHTAEGVWHASLSVYEQNCLDARPTAARSHQYYSYIVGPAGDAVVGTDSQPRPLSISLKSSEPIPDSALMSKIFMQLLNDFRRVYSPRIFSRGLCACGAGGAGAGAGGGALAKRFPTKYVLNDTDSWYVDSGASDHMCRHRDWFFEYEDFDEYCQVHIGNGAKITAYGKGNVPVLAWVANKWIKTYLPDVMYIPEMKVNLFSVVACLDKGIKMFLDNKTCMLMKNGTIVAVGERTHKMFTMKFKTIVQKKIV